MCDPIGSGEEASASSNQNIEERVKNALDIWIGSLYRKNGMVDIPGLGDAIQMLVAAMHASFSMMLRDPDGASNLESIVFGSTMPRDGDLSNYMAARIIMDIYPHRYLKEGSRDLMDLYYLVMELVDPSIKDEAAKVMKMVVSSILDILADRVESKYYDMRDNAAETLFELMRYQDEYTKMHTIRVGFYADTLASRVFGDDVSDEFSRASRLHDIGKLGVPKDLLMAPRALTDDEYEKVKQHTIIGGKVLFNIDASGMMVDVAMHHHERWDGKGYPSGRAGEEIPLPARIVAVADAFDALTTERPYSTAVSIQEAKRILIEESGKQFDPDLVSEFVLIPDDVIDMKSKIV